jgi:hypothetical protein
MRILNQVKLVVIGKTLLSLAVLAGVFVFVGGPRAAANDGDCRSRTARADHKLHEAIEHHGYNSRQANYWRHELHEVRERCWRENKRWWDVEGSRWHNGHDWDDHDHDHN